jgi:hypothetical protein
MLQNIKKIALNLTALALLLVPVVALPSTAFAADAIGGGLNCGAELDVNAVNGNGAPNCTSGSADAGTTFNRIITLIINIFSLVVGVIAVIMIIIGGLKYITSGGDSGNISSAKNTILYAVIGLVVVALAQFVVRFVLQKVGQSTGAAG